MTLGPGLAKNSDEYSSLTVALRMTRRCGYAVLNIYIPSFILLVISYATFYFQPDVFEVRVVSVLTVLLVTVTLFTQVKTHDFWH